MISIVEVMLDCGWDLVKGFKVPKCDFSLKLSMNEKYLEIFSSSANLIKLINPFRISSKATPRRMRNKKISTKNHFVRCRWWIDIFMSLLILDLQLSVFYDAWKLNVRCHFVCMFATCTEEGHKNKIPEINFIALMLLPRWKFQRNFLSFIYWEKREKKRR